MATGIDCEAPNVFHQEAADNITIQKRSSRFNPLSPCHFLDSISITPPSGEIVSSHDVIILSIFQSFANIFLFLTFVMKV